MLFPVYNCSSVWIVPAEDEEGGPEKAEMERLEKSSIAFFAGLSLISSPDKEGKKDCQNLSFYWAERRNSRRKRTGAMREKAR